MDIETKVVQHVSSPRNQTWQPDNLKPYTPIPSLKTLFSLLNNNKSAISFYKWKCPDSECVSDYMSLASTELLCSSQTQAWQPVSTKTDSDTKNYECWNWIFVEFINSNKSPKFTIVCETETEADEYQQLFLWLT